MPPSGKAAFAFSALVLSLVVAADAFAGDASASGGATLTANVVGLRNNKGRVGCVLFNSADGFPNDRGKVFRRASGPIHDGSASCEFGPLPGGTYAVVYFHDEDMTGKMRKNWMGIPQEEFGFSNDVRVKITTPSFEATSFPHDSQSQVLTLHPQYMGSD
ncbi:MAG TPA: DUF2141 domain-containing protein [Candidatus Binataceae bacterium]|nr:DUF2141 domain-containing protein [Candidatus Binataceae bacterium]